MKMSDNFIRDMAFFVFGLLILSVFLLGCSSTTVIEKCPQKISKTLIASK